MEVFACLLATPVPPTIDASAPGPEAIRGERIR